MDLLVLAGGRGRRLSAGRRAGARAAGGKPLLQLNGTSLIETVIGRLRALFDNVIVSSATGDCFPRLGAMEVADVYPNCGSLGGLHAGLLAAKSRKVFAVACDMPFVNQELVRMLIGRSRGFDIVVPGTAPDAAEPGIPGFMRLEPLHAVYSRRCIPYMEELLNRRSLRIFDFFDRVKVAYVGREEIQKLDPGMQSFFNINTPADFERASELLSGRTPPCANRGRR